MRVEPNRQLISTVNRLLEVQERINVIIIAVLFIVCLKLANCVSFLKAII